MFTQQSFKNEKENINSDNWFFLLPPEIKTLIFLYLQNKDVLNAMRVSTLFYRDLSRLVRAPILWTEIFITLGCDEKLIKDLMTLDAITDYRNLYRVLSHLPTSMREGVKHVWQLLCISGEPTAIEIGIEKNIITWNERDPTKDNILFYAALSGIPAQLDKIIELNNEIILSMKKAGDSEDTSTADKKIIPLEVTFDYLNILHFSILSGREEQIKKVLELEKLYNFQLPRNVTKRNKHPLHMAVISGYPEQVVAVMEIFKVGLLDVKDSRGNTPIEYASKKMRGVLHEMLTSSTKTVARIT